MKFDHETWVMIWLGMLLAPPILFGLWMRIRLSNVEGGQEFLEDRETSRIAAEEKQRRRHLSDELEEMKGKGARMTADLAALGGTHGGEVYSILKQAIPFLLYYVVYCGIIGLLGYLLLF